MRFATAPDGTVWLDHILLGTPDVEQTSREVADALGVEVVAGGRHRGLGTSNQILGLTGSYLEIIGPDPEDPDFSGKRWFGLDQVTEPRIVSWSAGVADIDRATRDARAAGWDPGDTVAQDRKDAEGGTISWRRSDTAIDRRDGLVPFLVEWTDTPSPADTLPPAATIESLELTHPEPDEIARVFAALGLAHLQVQQGPARVQAVLRAGDRTLTI